jgi:RNA polymerase sigma-70 factor (ECF subfamily)
VDHRRSFATTRWSIVLRAADRHAPDSREALASLCATYWYPLYAFVRRKGHPAEEAEDLTQEFFARLLEKGFLEDVGPGKGRFRSFLLVCLKRFMANEWDRKQALKRGGGKRIVSIDVDEAEERYRMEPAHEMTAEKVYERRWALTVLARAVGRVSNEYRLAGKGALFEALKEYLVADAGAEGYTRVAEWLGMTVGAVRVAVHRMRAKYRDALTAEIAGTVDNPAEVDAEIAQLLDAISAGGNNERGKA